MPQRRVPWLRCSLATASSATSLATAAATVTAAPIDASFGALSERVPDRVTELFA